MKVLPHTHGCFVCGEANPIGFHLRFQTDGRIVQARFVPETKHVTLEQIEESLQAGLSFRQLGHRTLLTQGEG